MICPNRVILEYNYFMLKLEHSDWSTNVMLWHFRSLMGTVSPTKCSRRRWSALVRQSVVWNANNRTGVGTIDRPTGSKTTMYGFTFNFQVQRCYTSLLTKIRGKVSVQRIPTSSVFFKNTKSDKSIRFDKSKFDFYVKQTFVPEEVRFESAEKFIETFPEFCPFCPRDDEINKKGKIKSFGLVNEVGHGFYSEVLLRSCKMWSLTAFWLLQSKLN